MKPQKNSTISEKKIAAAGYFSRGQRAIGLLVIIIALTMGLSGLLSIEAGSLMHTKPLLSSSEASQRIKIIDELRQKKSIDEGNVKITEIGLETALVAKSTSEAHIVNSRLGEQFVYYATMPALNSAMLSLHTALAGFCMLVGAFQFWPVFRKRHPKLHRGFGMTYVITAQLSMLFAAAYLVLTPPDKLYTGLTGYVALWAIAAMITVTLWLAMYHIKRREIGQHQGYMALNFGLLMVAPMLRWNWVLLGNLMPSVDQETINLSTLVFLVPESFLAGYALICLNRAQQRMRPQAATSIIAEAVRAQLPRILIAVTLFSAACAITIVLHYMVSPGLEQSSYAQQVVPATVLQHEANTLGAEWLTRWLYVFSSCSALLIAPWFIRSGFQQLNSVVSTRLRHTGFILALGAGISGAMQFYWGWQLGLPAGQAHLSGGTFYTIAGLTSLAFSLLLSAALLSNKVSLVKEWGIFTFLSCTFSALFYWSMAAMSWLPIPSSYINAGQVYQLAGGIAPFMLLLALFYAIHGQASRERFAV